MERIARESPLPGGYFQRRAASRGIVDQWSTDLVTGDHFLGSASMLAAVSGYPHITVPMGQVRDLPVGLSFFGQAWSEAKLIGLAYAYEQRSQARQAPHFRPSSP